MQTLVGIDKITETLDYPFMLCNLDGKKSFFANSLALKLYGDDDGTVDIEKLFQNAKTQISFEKKIKDELIENGAIAEFEMTTITNSGKEKIFEIKVGFSDQNNTEIYILFVNIEERLQKENELHIFHKYFNAMQSLTNESLYTVDVETKLLQCQGIAARELGLPAEVHGYPQCVYDWVYPEHLDAFKKFTSDSLAGIESKLELKIKNINDEFKWYELYNMIILDAKGEVFEILGRIKNIHRERDLESNNSLMNLYFNAIQSLSGESLYTVDVKTKVLKCQGIAAYELGLPAEVPEYPQCIYSRVYPDDLENFKYFTNRSLLGHESKLDLRIKNINGEFKWYELYNMIIRDDAEDIFEILGRIKDISKLHDLEQRATHDLMTDVFNKMSFEENVSKVFKNSSIDERHALVFIDLDDFKSVNDTLGHAFGDALLIAVGDRLKSAVNENDLVGRLGGDEFAVLLKFIDDDDSAILRTKNLLSTLQEDFSFEGTKRVIKASLGVSIYPNHGAKYKELIEKSDNALYFSKKRGKNIVTLYNPNSEASETQKMVSFSKLTKEEKAILEKMWEHDKPISLDDFFEMYYNNDLKLSEKSLLSFGFDRLIDLGLVKKEQQNNKQMYTVIFSLKEYEFIKAHEILDLCAYLG